MEDGLVPFVRLQWEQQQYSLNPYCSGRWSRTTNGETGARTVVMSLNPYCSGRWSRTFLSLLNVMKMAVLILIVVEDGLVLSVELTERAAGEQS